MGCARTRTSVGRPRWTWRSTCSTACWTWDARNTSASPEPRRDWGHCARIPDPCTTASHAQIGRAQSSEHRSGPRSARARPAAEPRRVGLRIAPHPRGSLSSTLEHVPELLDLLWGQLLAAAHKAQHLLALDLTLPFTG